MEAVTQWMQALLESCAKDQFVQLSLGKKGSKQQDLENIYGRLIELRGSLQLSLTWHYRQRDEVHNYQPREAVEVLRQLLGNEFLEAYLFTLEGDHILRYNRKRKPRYQKQKPSKTERPARKHNQSKQYLLPADRPFLELLGIAKDGEILPSRQAKYKQINKYLEIVQNLLQDIPKEAPLRIVDMGSGKGYLTFALYDYLQEVEKRPLRLTGIELRQSLVDFCNQQASALGWEGLDFVASDIRDYDLKQIDVLIALHACDTATDLAMAQGVFAQADLILTAPCCHKQIRREMRQQEAAELYQPLLKHGILQERQAEMLTDSMRALLLEQSGYDTKVFEFISSAHTNKNLMISAQKHHRAVDKQGLAVQLQQLKSAYGIGQHYLEKLLAEGL